MGAAFGSHDHFSLIIITDYQNKCKNAAGLKAAPCFMSLNFKKLSNSRKHVRKRVQNSAYVNLLVTLQ
jgi:hypothetical protein